MYKPCFTVETTFRLPINRRRVYEAESVIDACRLAVADEGWSDAREDFDTSGETYVTGIWAGASGYESEWRPIPSHFDESVQRMADHFRDLMLSLDEAAQPGGLSRSDFESWLPKAQVVVAKAKAIIEGRPDPDDITA